MAAVLIAVAGPLEGACWPLEAELSLGRDKANTIALEDSSLSRRHCTITPTGSDFVLRDLDSSNGTFLNGKPISEQSLAHGDQIRAGRSIFRFSAVDEEPRRAAESGAAVGVTQVLRLSESTLLRPEAVQTESLRHGLQALARLFSALAGVRSVEALAARIVDTLRECTPAEHVAVLLATNESGDYTVLAQGGGDCSVSRAALEQAINDGTAVLAQGEGSVLVAPISARAEGNAAIYLFSKASSGFTKDHLDLVAAIAGAVAQPLEGHLHIRRLEAENQRLLAEMHIEHDMVGNSRHTQSVFSFVAKAAPSSATVLIRGESGTGKELVARAIHRNSARARGPFVAINCAALTESLLESELFGHEKGAFTGAVTQKRGRIEEAQGGTLFLDEIGELAPTLQPKILRVLQEREFERVGGTRSLKADIRLITATHRDLEAMVRSGAFRQDLYYRLNVVAVTLTPLRDRRDDIPLLAQHFIKKHGRDVGRRVIGLNPAARALLCRYDWPGNVRELENAIERALVLGSSDHILLDDLPEHISESSPSSTPGNPGVFQEQVRNAKREIVESTLAAAGRDFNVAARQLGLHPSNLYRMVRSLGLKP